MTDLSNYNLILVKAKDNIQRQRLMDRGLTQEQIDRRLASQYDFAQKQALIKQEIKDQQHGQLWVIDNSTDKQPDLQALWRELKKLIPQK